METGGVYVMWYVRQMWKKRTNSKRKTILTRGRNHAVLTYYCDKPKEKEKDKRKRKNLLLVCVTT